MNVLGLMFVLTYMIRMTKVSKMSHFLNSGTTTTMAPSKLFCHVVLGVFIKVFLIFFIIIFLFFYLLGGTSFIHLVIGAHGSRPSQVYLTIINHHTA